MPRLVSPVVQPGSLAAVAQPTIPVDDGLSLAPFDLADAPAVLEAFGDPDIQRWHFRRFDDVDEAEAWIGAAHEGWRSETAATWAIRSAPEAAVLGRISLYPWARGWLRRDLVLGRPVGAWKGRRHSSAAGCRPVGPRRRRAPPARGPALGSQPRVVRRRREGRLPCRGHQAKRAAPCRRLARHASALAPGNGPAALSLDR